MELGHEFKAEVKICLAELQVLWNTGHETEITLCL
jgi:hypothetical protein